MEKSPQVINLAKALIKFKLECPKIPKKSKNPFFKSMYAALPDIQDTIDPVLNTMGLIYMQHPEPGDMLTTILIHADSGEFMQSTININPLYEYKEEKDNNRAVIWRSEHAYVTPQTMGSAITYAKRYALVAILGLNVDDDDDGNAGSGNVNQQETKKEPFVDTRKDLTPSDKKEWSFQLLNLQNNKYGLDVLLRTFKISDVDQAELLKQVKKGKPILKPGTDQWTKSIEWLSKEGSKIDTITWKYSISDQDLIDLLEDVLNYTPQIIEAK